MVQLLPVLLGGLMLAPAPSIVAANFPLRAGPTQRYLVDRSGEPFLMHADTPWSLIVALTTNEVEVYLEARKGQGFNTIMVNLIEHLYMGVDNVAGPPRNRSGQAPFLVTGDFSTINEAYFAHADWVLRQAASKGMAVLLTPCYMGFPGNESGWYKEVKANGAGKCRDYGRFVGQRYKDFPNLIWVMYGDRNVDDATPMVEAMVAGLREADPNHLITAHFQRTVAARDYLNGSPWLTLDSAYTTDIVHPHCFKEYNRTPPMPFFLIEARYENEHDMTTAGLRRQAYSALLSGASGHCFGNRPVWLFDGGWQAGLSSPGANSMTHVARLFLSRRWTALVPDEAHQVVTSGFSSGATYVASARAADGSSIIAYLPVGGTITVDLRRAGGTQAKAWWYNVRDGSAAVLGLYPTTGSVAFSAPSSEDWVLVIDDAARAFGPPGVPSRITASLGVDAGPDQWVAWPPATPVRLTGKVSLDGVPLDGESVTSGHISVRWQVSGPAGPAAVTYDPSPSVVNPVVTVPGPGRYEFLLTAWNSAQTNSDGVVVVLETSRPPLPPTALMVDGQVNPFGLRNASPVFTWVFADPDPGDSQSALQVEVIGPGTALVWKSGRIAADRASLDYAGPPLVPGTAYRWRVSVWDQFNLGSGWSELAWLTLSSLSPELLVNPGFEAGDSRGWTEAVPGSMSVGFKPPSGRSPPRTGNHQAFWVVSSPTHSTRQRVDLSVYGAAIDAGAAWLDATGWLVADDYRADPPWDQFKLQVRFFEPSGLELVAHRYDSGNQNVPTWGRHGLQSFRIPAGVRAVEIQFNTWEFGYDAGVADDFSVRVHTLPTDPSVLLNAPAQTWAEILGSGFRLALSANHAGQYRVESSPDLVLWTPVTTVDYVEGTVWVVDPAVSSPAGRFYRAGRAGL